MYTYNLLIPLPFKLRKGQTKSWEGVPGVHKFRTRGPHYDWILYSGAECSGVLIVELAACHVSGSSNFEMDVRLLEVSLAPALRNAHCTRPLKCGHVSLCVNIYYYVTEFISLYQVIYLCTFCILFRQIMSNTKPIYIPALCDVKPTWFIVRCNTVCVRVRNSKNTSLTPNWGFRDPGQTRSMLTWHAWKFIQ